MHGASHSGKTSTILLLAVLLASSSVSTTAVADKNADTSTLRWAEGEPGCTFSRDDDGKYRYGFWTADYWGCARRGLTGIRESASAIRLDIRLAIDHSLSRQRFAPS